MQPLEAWQDAELAPPLPLPSPRPKLPPAQFSAAVAAAVWRATEIGSTVSSVVSCGWAALDAQLPGGGWPCQSVIEVLCPQPSVLEWRIFGPALRKVVADGRQVVIVGPPKNPHLPGLLHEGLDQRQLVWIKADAPAERLWVTEQLIKSNSVGAIISWLPQARQEQIRRLQIHAQGCDGLVFLCRPQSAQHESSAAPLRAHVTYALDWELHVQVFKRRGPVHDGFVVIPSIPGGLTSVLTPRMRTPSRIAPSCENVHALGSLAPRHDTPVLAVH